MTRRVVAWGPAAAWAAFLFLMSSRSALPVNLDSGLDKVAHFGAYLVLGMLSTHSARNLNFPAFIAIGVGWTYGAFDEFHQALVPGRQPSMGDWAADVAGTIVGVSIYLLFLRARTREPVTPGLDGAEPTR